MDVTEQARRSDALHYDNVSRRELCNMVARLESDLEDSKAKNAKTLEVGTRWMAKAARLESENTKLRELVADAWGYISHPANATWTHEKRKEVRHSLSDRMRELGVEVPDGD